MNATAMPGGDVVADPRVADAETARIMTSAAFRELQRKRAAFGWLLTGLMLVIYYGFVALVAFAPGVIGVRVMGSVTSGLALGIGVIVAAIVLTGLYVLRANGEFDRLQAEVVRQAGRAP